MAYRISSSEGSVGFQAIEEISTTKKHRLGTEVRVDDDANGWSGTAVYVEFPVSTAITAGLLVTPATVITGTSTPFRMQVLATGTGAGLGVPVFVTLTAVGSNAALQYGWALVIGVASTYKTAVSPLFSSALGISATAGRVFITTTSSDQLLGLRLVQSSVASGTSVVNIYYNRAHTGVIL